MSLYIIIGLLGTTPKFTEYFTSDLDVKADEDPTVKMYINQFQELAVGSTPINNILLYKLDWNKTEQGAIPNVVLEKQLSFSNES